MKTTIDIADPLLRRAKKLAAQQNTTLRAVIEIALRNTLDTATRLRPPSTVRTHTFKGNGLQPGLSWDGWEKLRTLIYDGHGG